MRRLPVIATALGFAALLTGAFADELPTIGHKLLSDDDIASILARNRKGLQPDPLTPLCASPNSMYCRVFALSSKTTAPPALEPPTLQPSIVAPGSPLTSPVPAAVNSSPLSISCPKEGQVGFCHIVDSLTDISPGSAGATLYLGGSQAAYLSKRAASGLLTSEEIRGVINEKTIGILPEAVEASAADSAVSMLARSAIAKTSRGAAAVGVVLMTYAAYRYFYPEKETPADPSEKK